VLMLRYTQALITQMAQTASKLQQLGVISYTRGLITVRDRPRLEALSCECYEVVRRETDLLLAYLPQRQVIRNTDSIPTVTLPTSDTAKILVAERRSHVS